MRTRTIDLSTIILVSRPKRRAVDSLTIGMCRPIFHLFPRTKFELPQKEENVSPPEFTHFDEQGGGRMVDVGAKEITARRARAGGQVSMRPETLQMILDRKVAKGDVFEVARLAGIMASKRTSELIPLCHPLGLDSVEVKLSAADACTVKIEATVSVHARTGVEMEALTSVSVAALTLYDMCKGVDRGMVIGPIALLEKTGGKSGTYLREPGSNLSST